MERLTRRIGNSIDFVDGKGYGSMSHEEGVRLLFEKLVDYEDAAEQKRLVVLPCKSDDVIYQVRKKSHAYGAGISSRIVSCVSVWGDGSYSVHHQGMTDCHSSDFNKTWFLTREEAESALNSRP